MLPSPLFSCVSVQQFPHVGHFHSVIVLFGLSGTSLGSPIRSPFPWLCEHLNPFSPPSPGMPFLTAKSLEPARPSSPSGPTNRGAGRQARCYRMSAKFTRGRGWTINRCTCLITWHRREQPVPRSIVHVWSAPRLQRIGGTKEEKVGYFHVSGLSMGTLMLSGP